MKLNKIAKICLFIAVLLVGGVLIAQAHGFISYEDNEKLFLWDNVRIVDHGLNLGGAAYKGGGNINIADKDIYLRKLMGINCPGYPSQFNCQALMGDLGNNIFAYADKIKSNADLTLSSASGLKLSGDSINFNGKLIILNNRNLVVSDSVTDEFLAGKQKSVFTNVLKTNYLNGNPALSLPNIRLEEDATFNLNRIINIELYDAGF